MTRTATALTVRAWRFESDHSSAGFDARELANRVATIGGRLPHHEATFDVSPRRAQ